MVHTIATFMRGAIFFMVAITLAAAAESRPLQGVCGRAAKYEVDSWRAPVAVSWSRGRTCVL